MSCYAECTLFRYAKGLTMPGPKPTPVMGDIDLPKRVDVVVIGGGIIGSSTALELAERGIRVALCEKGWIGHEQSSRNWGWVRISRRSRRELPLMAEALRIWPKLNERTGRDVGYQRSGIGFACKTEADISACQPYMDELRPFQIKLDILRPKEAEHLYPGYREDVEAIAFNPADGRAEPQLAAPAIAEAARDKGAAVLTECAVRGVETAGGLVSGVVTEKGSIVCDAVVLAGGAWSRLFSGNLGIDLPQLKVMNTVLRTDPLPGGPDAAFFTNGMAFRKRQDGGYTIANGEYNVVDLVPDSLRIGRQFLPIFRKQRRDLKLRIGSRFGVEMGYARRWQMDEVTPFEQTRVLDPKPHQSSVDQALKRAAEVFEIFEQAKVAQTWAGLIDATPDVVPVISDVAELPGFYMATGFSGHGFGIGPGAGRLMADMVSGAKPCVDPTPFRLSRFFDGSDLVLDGGF